MSDPIEVDIGGYALDPLMHDNQQLRGHPAFNHKEYQ